MKKEFKEAIEDSPIIAAIKDDEGLKKCLTSESHVIFILYEIYGPPLHYDSYFANFIWWCHNKKIQPLLGGRPMSAPTVRFDVTVETIGEQSSPIHWIVQTIAMLRSGIATVFTN